MLVLAVEEAERIEVAVVGEVVVLEELAAGVVVEIVVAVEETTRIVAVQSAEQASYIRGSAPVAAGLLDLYFGSDLYFPVA